MFHKILFALLTLCVVGLGVMVHCFSDTSGLLKEYQKFGFSASDFQYKAAEKTWGSGLVFYQVSFPFVPVPLRADQMKLVLSDTGMTLYLKNAYLYVTEGLSRVHGDKLKQNLTSYQPYQHFFDHFLTSLAVMGMDEFSGDIVLQTTYDTAESLRFSGQMFQNKKPLIQMTGSMRIPLVGAHQFSDLWNGRLLSAEVVLDESLFNRYLYYAQSRQTPVPDFVGNNTIKTPTQSLFSFKESLR